MGNDAKNFLDQWIASARIIGESGSGIAPFLLAEAKRQGLTELELQEAAGGDIDRHLVESLADMSPQ